MSPAESSSENEPSSSSKQIADEINVQNDNVFVNPVIADLRNERQGPLSNHIRRSLNHHRASSAILPLPKTRSIPSPPRLLRSSSLDGPSSSATASASRFSLLRTPTQTSFLLSEVEPRTNRLLRRASSFGKTPIIFQIPSTPIGEEEESKKQSKSLRWVILMLSCFLLFGNLYAYDNPAALNIPLQKYLGHDYDTWQYELNLLYSVYSFPNMLLPFFGGQLVDAYDSRVVLTFFSLTVCLGQTLFAIGTGMKNFGLMLFGRILFGIGGESISVVQASITSQWFKHNELAFALGMNLCIARFGSVVNAILSPRIEILFGVSAAVWIGALSCYLSFLCALVLIAIISSIPNHSDGITPSSATPSRARSHSSDTMSETLTEVSEATPLLAAIDQSDSQLSEDDRSSHETKNKSFILTAIVQYITDMKYFPGTFWMVCLICILLYGTVVPFNNIASDFLMSKWYPGDTQKAGLVMSIPDTMSAILVPICGFIVDHYGGRASALLLCATVIACVHLVLGLTYWDPIPSLVFLGLSYSMYGVAIWPSIATVVQHREEELKSSGIQRKLVGSAFGISTSALNTALTIMPLLAAKIRVAGNSFLPVELFFAGLAVLGAFCSGGLWIIDVHNGGVLQNPEIQHEMNDKPPGYGHGERASYQESDESVPASARGVTTSAQSQSPTSMDGSFFDIHIPSRSDEVNSHTQATSSIASSS